MELSASSVVPRLRSKCASFRAGEFLPLSGATTGPLDLETSSEVRELQYHCHACPTRLVPFQFLSFFIDQVDDL